MEHYSATGNFDSEAWEVKFMSVDVYILMKKITPDTFKPVNNARWSRCDKNVRRKRVLILHSGNVCDIIVFFSHSHLSLSTSMSMNISNVLLNIFNQINFYDNNEWTGTTLPLGLLGKMIPTL